LFEKGFRMVSTQTPHSKPETRLRLLQAAGEIFAACGYHNAKIQDICRLAGANIAAVNYHFGDKARLYKEVLRQSYADALERYPVIPGQDRAMTPVSKDAEARLHAFVRSFLMRIFDKSHSALHGKLMAREMIEPTPALDGLVEEVVRPICRTLWAIVEEMLGPGATAQEIRFHTWSVVGQCLFYHHSYPMNSRLFPEQRYDLEDIERLARHITDFSLCGLKAFAERNLAAQ
jgi:TetR/AcrR family transcriptional regulator, regulator of cefoperazone and chloramphenicol sensitivity